MFSDSISSWSSGTGAAGILGALAFAVLTDHRLLAFSPQKALLMMLVVPTTLFFTYWKILVNPSTIHRINFLNPINWIRQQMDHHTPLTQSPNSSVEDLQALLRRDDQRNAYSVRKAISNKLRKIKV